MKRHADPVTIGHVVELRKKLAEAERQRDNALNVVRDLHKQIRKLREQLDVNDRNEMRELRE